VTYQSNSVLYNAPFVADADMEAKHQGPPTVDSDLPNKCFDSKPTCVEVGRSVCTYILSLAIDVLRYMEEVVADRSV